MSKDSSPSVIARETLRQLSALKISPTPDNYHKLYDKISGTSSNILCDDACKMLADFASKFSLDHPELLEYSNKLKQAANDKRWLEYQIILMDCIGFLTTSAYSSKMSDETTSEPNVAWAGTIAKLIKQLERNRSKLTIAKKREGLEWVLSKFAKDSTQLHIKLQALMNSWTEIEAMAPEQVEIEVEKAEGLSQSKSHANATIQDPVALNSTSLQQTDMVSQFQELLTQILGYIATQQLGDAALSEEARLLAQQVKEIQEDHGLAQFISCFKQFCVKFESCGEQGIKLQQGLLRLLNLLIDSTGELLVDDQWVTSQMTKLRESISNPMDLQAVAQAERYLKELMQKQNIIRNSLVEAKVALKNMVTSLVENIEILSDATGEYHDKINDYSEKISQSDDVEVLHELLVELMQETKKMQASVLNSRNDFLEARAKVDAAQNKIDRLESELVEMGEKVQEDHLTGVLNRRGLDNAFECEASRAQRKKVPLCVAILDIDNFKLLNDTHGHKVGDDALVCLVEAIKHETRSEDVVARFGGEEFVILLPETGIEGAISILTRIKRSLTKRFFLHENKRLLITFSAGIAEYRHGELQESIIKRADEAMYCAKNNGKNQILASTV